MKTKGPIHVDPKAYWDARFASGDWERKGGRSQTRRFAESQMGLLNIPPSFTGTILDFGCGLGDAIPVYRTSYPNASLIGMDISGTAIEMSRRTYGHLARFFQGDTDSVPEADIIIASNILEHCADDIQIAAELLKRCNDLFVITPYLETLIPHGEHVHSYDENHFNQIGPYSYMIFESKGWGDFSWPVRIAFYLKNMCRKLMGMRKVSGPKQIMFHFKSV